MKRELTIEKDSNETTNARFNEAFFVESRFNNLRLFLTLKIKSKKLYNFSIDIALKDEERNFRYLKTNLTKVEDLKRIDLDIKGRDLLKSKLIISSGFQKIDPQGLVLKDNELEDDFTIELNYDLEAGFEQLIDEFKVEGLFPKSITEWQYTEIDFN